MTEHTKNDQAKDARATLNLAGPHRQHWLGTIQRLNLRFLINGKHCRIFRWIHVQANNIDYFLSKIRIIADFEIFEPMRF